MEAKARGAPTPASLCALQAAGLAQGPTPSPRHARAAPVSSLGVATLAMLRPSYLSSNRTVARPERPGELGRGVPGGDCLAPAGARTLAGRRTERPPRPPPAPPLRGGRSRQPPIGTFGEEASPIRSPLLRESPPLKRPWPMGGRSFFRRRPDARASWASGGPAAHADGWARDLSSGRLRAEGTVGSVVRAEAGREVPGLVLVQAYVRVETAGAWPVRRVGFGRRLLWVVCPAVR